MTSMNLREINHKIKLLKTLKKELQQQAVAQLMEIFATAAEVIQEMPENPDQTVVDELNRLLTLCNASGANPSVIEHRGYHHVTRQRKTELLRHFLRNREDIFTRKDLENYFNRPFTFIQPVLNDLVEDGSINVKVNKEFRGGRYEYTRT